MGYLKCIHKIKNNNNTISEYIIIDEFGNTEVFGSAQLKELMTTNKIEIKNLKLSSNYKIIDKHVTKEDIDSMIESLNKVITKAKLVAPDKIIIYEDGTVILNLKPGLNILYIPDNIEKLEPLIRKAIKDYSGALHVIGGRGLIYTDSMFSNTSYKYINLDYLDTSNVISMINMFLGCQAEYISLKELNTSKATRMASMFNNCNSVYLDLSNFDTSKVRDMKSMFESCKCNELDLHNFDTREVVNMSTMFRLIHIETLDLNSFNTPKLNTAYGMFMHAVVCNLKLFYMRVNEDTELGDMFYSSTINKAYIADDNINKKYNLYKELK